MDSLLMSTYALRPHSIKPASALKAIKWAQNMFSDEVSNITSIEEEVIIRSNVMIYQFLPMRRLILYDIEEMYDEESLIL